jgi:hypothetical protein
MEGQLPGSGKNMQIARIFYETSARKPFKIFEKGATCTWLPGGAVLYHPGRRRQGYSDP